MCSKGTNCTFAHEKNELRDKPNLFKTKLCPEFERGYCRNGNTCKFAHGEKDLRSTSDFFKTALCLKW